MKGKETLEYLEGLEEFRSSEDYIKRRIQEMPMALGSQMNRSPEQIKKDEEVTQAKNKRRKASQRIVIRDSGVYKFERSDREMINTSAVD